MPKTYTIVSIYGNTGAELNKFLSEHKRKYPTAVGFVDEAVMEKIRREESIPDKVPLDIIFESDMGKVV